MVQLLVGGQWLEYADDRLAIAILRSPTNVEAARILLGGKLTLFDISQYRSTKLERKGEHKMRKIPNAPKYGINEVVDLSYVNGGLPNRILITAVFMREQDKEWMYKVAMENTGSYTTMEESFISTRESKKAAKVYQNPDIIKRIEEGFRFCGNFPDEEARRKAKMIAEAKNISDVRLYPGLWPNNSLAKGKKGIWIRYNYTIANDGSTHNIYGADSAEIIKGHGGAGACW